MSLSQRLFGPSKKAIWQQLSDELGARFVDGGWWKGDKIEVHHNEWTLTLDTYAVSTGKVTVIFTRMRAPFVNPTGFRFNVYRRGVFTGLGKFLGMQDIEIGDPEFDDAFVIKSADESRIRALLSNRSIRALVSQLKDVQFSVKDDEGWFGTKFPDGVDELHYQVVGIVKDPEQLKVMFEMFAETLDELCRMGAAASQEPGVTLK